MLMRAETNPARIKILLAACCCLVLAGCASRSITFESMRPVQANDPSRKSVAHVSSGVIGWMALPRRDLIRVDFTSRTDLRDLVARQGNILFMHSYFCAAGDGSRSVGDPGVYVDLTAAKADTIVNQFYFFIDVTQKANPDSIPPELGFDLSVKAEDICFYVTANGAATTYRSSMARIPKDAVERLFTGRVAR